MSPDDPINIGVHYHICWEVSQLSPVQFVADRYLLSVLHKSNAI